jgi:hypothetical protein
VIVLRAVTAVITVFLHFTAYGRFLLFVFWLSCRLGARRCPACGEDWHTELVGEWDGEDWRCGRCGHFWIWKDDRI